MAIRWRVVLAPKSRNYIASRVSHVIIFPAGAPDTISPGSAEPGPRRLERRRHLVFHPPTAFGTSARRLASPYADNDW